MSFSVDNIINVVTRISSGGLSFANFSSATLFITETEDTASIGAGNFADYGSLSDMGSAGFLSDSQPYLAASKWLTGEPRGPQIRVYVMDDTDATVVDSLIAARNDFYWYWTFFTSAVYADLANVPAIATWHDGADSYFINCATGAAATAIRTNAGGNIAATLTTQGTRRCTTLAHETDAYAGISLARWFATVNFQAADSTITGDLKALSNVSAESLNNTQYNNMLLDTNKCAFYTQVDLQGSTVAGRTKNTRSHSSFGEWMDDVFNLDGFINTLKVTLFNVLDGQVSKLPQTPAGQSALITATRSVCQTFVDNGYLGPRNYTNPDTGLEAFTVGYEILTQPEDILNISDSDRDNRKAAPIRVRLFRAGAIHAVDVTLDVY